MFVPSKEIEIEYPIPKGKVGAMIGIQGSNIKKLSNESKTIMRVQTGYNPRVIIRGTKENCNNAMKLISQTLDMALLPPTLGLTILEIGDITNLSDAKFKFVKCDGYNYNIRTVNRAKYYVEKIKPVEKKEEKLAALEDDVGLLVELFGNQAKVTNLYEDNHGYVTSDKLDDCLNEVSERLSNVDPVGPVNKEIRLTIFFGREIFVNVQKEIFNMNDWCNFRRGRGMASSFQHHSPNVKNNLKLLQERFGFRKSSKDKNRHDDDDKYSITIYYLLHKKRRKLKLHWDKDKNLWQITSAVRDINRFAILDIISGSSSIPDLRFLLKTQYECHVKEDIVQVINNLQSKPLAKRDGMWFKQSDFADKINCTTIRQTLHKERYLNNKYQITFLTTITDTDGEIFKEESIDLKNISWRFVENIDNKPSRHFNEDELGKTIRETIKFAREVAKAFA